MRSVHETADDLAQLQEHYYIVERYLAGLARLTVVAYPEERNTDSIFVTFSGVKYMQLPTFWQKAPFALGTPDECKVLLESIGMNEVSSLPVLFYVQLPKLRAYVVCWGIEISKEMPPP